MNKDETLALYAQGKDAWNAWAEKMLAEPAELQDGTWADEAVADFGGYCFAEAAHFEGFIFPGSACFDQTKFEKPAYFEGTKFNERVDFVKATFSEVASFIEVMFGGHASFAQATFSGHALFRDSTFSQEARFDSAAFSDIADFTVRTFSRDAWFIGATFGRITDFAGARFGKNARFDLAKFNGKAMFEHATFSGKARFSGVTFSGDACFDGAKFKNGATFIAARGDRGFSLNGVRFDEVPDFIQAHFLEAPRLDNLVIPEAKGLWNYRSGKKDADGTAARYRALKRLAIQAHDHMLELDFFASELKMSRGAALFIARFFYELFSNFGRWIVLPLMWWAAAAVGFAWAYLGQHFARTSEIGSGYVVSSRAWLWSWIASWISDTPTQRLKCLVEQHSNPLRVAFDLSIRKALPFPGIGSTEELYLIYTCLYGRYDESLKYTPVIPDCVACLAIIQTLLSLLLIFLFLLAVRNHFRIR